MPDYAFYFPINRPSANSLLALEPRQESALFSLPALKELYNHGLRPSSFHPFKNSFKEKHLKCFPWLVVESKPKQGTNGAIARLREVAYCQAINGSGCASRLKEFPALNERNLPGLAAYPPSPSRDSSGAGGKGLDTVLYRELPRMSLQRGEKEAETGKGLSAGPSRRRESGTKFLAGPIEVEVDGSTSDEDYDENEEDDDSGDDDEECEDDDETGEEESDEKNLVWDYVRRQATKDAELEACHEDWGS
ncbi:hypothetical protein FVEG_09445 [Fusarium verticillioides 7600]|uniref:Uncharacterized protein n=1 Tax=Gibberella moniliformis (strain M3125 / FGSC 7600) TaxID=334819 RepID=W7MR77_GIBM7|nr:hypothetical protein FVEG_09445 [Fusarium verticillioides 7600]EWG50125.1 hypothetical protein FVEG_09445 [Fusarium verticillioides 7600]